MFYWCWFHLFDTHVLLVVYFFFLEFQLLQPSEIDPAWDRWPFTGLQHIHAHIPQPDRAIPESGLSQSWTQSGNRPKACGLIITTRHITAHCTTSYQHTCSDRNLKALVGVLCLLVKTQQKPCSAVTVLEYPPEKPAKITETKQKHKKRDTYLLLFPILPILSLLSCFSTCVFLLFHLNSV